MTTAASIIDQLRSDLRGRPAFLAGSLVAEDVYGLTNAHDDADLFVPSPQALISIGQHLIDAGYTLDSRFERVWHRWLKYGFNNWHTNSLKLEGPGGVEVNLVYKLVEKAPTKNLSAVLESFDFGLLGAGWDMERDTFHDMRSYLFPTHKSDGPLPLMPNKRDNWRNGFISQYNGLREAGRYAKYYQYGYDLSLVADDLLLGYYHAGQYLSQRSNKDKQLLAEIYETIAIKIEDDQVQELADFGHMIPSLDSLDQIMEALE